jgi:hypothetical protein
MEDTSNCFSRLGASIYPDPLMGDNLSLQRQLYEINQSLSGEINDQNMMPGS